MPQLTNRAAIEKAERELREQAGPLVTQEQLDRILSISSIEDPSERVQRLNEIHEDLQRQASAIELHWQALQVKLNRLPKLSPADQQTIDELNAEMIAGIRAEAASLLNRDMPVMGTGVPRRLRMTI